MGRRYTNTAHLKSYSVFAELVSSIRNRPSNPAL